MCKARYIIACVSTMFFCACSNSFDYASHAQQINEARKKLTLADSVYSSTTDSLATTLGTEFFFEMLYTVDTAFSDSVDSADLVSNLQLFKSISRKHQLLEDTASFYREKLRQTQKALVQLQTDCEKKLHAPDSLQLFTTNEIGSAETIIRSLENVQSDKQRLFLTCKEQMAYWTKKLVQLENKAAGKKNK
jgi:hypothetical protein